VSTLAWIILFTFIGGALSVLAAAIFLILPVSLRERMLPHFISFAIGALLGATFIGLLPHAVENSAHVHGVMMTVLLGVLAFFVLEKMVLWRHCHADGREVPPAGRPHNHHAVGIMILVGDGFHNFVDGVLIAAAFLTAIHLGIVTSLAIAAHEIPQEVGDFAVLLYSGFSRARALVFNLISSLTSIAGGVLAYYSLSDAQQALPYILAVAAASFIYIAVADLIPGLHQRTELAATAKQLVLIAAGVTVIYSAHAALH